MLWHRIRNPKFARLSELRIHSKTSLGLVAVVVTGMQLSFALALWLYSLVSIATATQLHGSTINDCGVIVHRFIDGALDERFMRIFEGTGVVVTAGQQSSVEINSSTLLFGERCGHEELMRKQIFGFIMQMAVFASTILPKYQEPRIRWVYL